MPRPKQEVGRPSSLRACVGGIGDAAGTDMSARTYWWCATLITAGGVVFSGYLSGVKLLNGVCAFDEPCPLFLGYPVCYTGLALFVSLFLVSATALTTRTTMRWPVGTTLGLSVLGVLFAGRLTLVEMVARGRLPLYGMGLPTCAYGFLFFLAVLVLSTIAWRSKTRTPPNRTAGHGSAASTQATGRS